MMLEVEKDGIVGYGEASMPPYLGESQASADAFLRQVDLAKYPDPFQLEEVLRSIDAIAPGNPSAKALEFTQFINTLRQEEAAALNT